MIEFVPACSFRCDAYGDEAALTIYRLWWLTTFRLSAMPTWSVISLFYLLTFSQLRCSEQ